MSEAIKALWLIQSPDHSGVSLATRHLAAGMVKNAAAPLVFALSGGENASDFIHLGCEFAVQPNAGRLFFGKQALRAAASAGVNLVHVMSPELVKRGMRLAKGLGVPLLATVNRLDEAEFKSLANFQGQGIIAISDAIRVRLVGALRLEQSRIRVIPNGLDLSRLPRPVFSQSHLQIPGRAPVVGTLGQLAERKGQRVFLQAVKELLDKGVDAEFVILGDGPDRMALRDLAERLHVARRVTFTPQTVSGHLSQLDVLVEPSYQEGLGLSVMQAMAVGVPVVATGVGGLYSLIEDGKTGLMVPAGDSSALAAAILRLLRSPAERTDLARSAREVIETEFDVDRIAERLLQYYSECKEGFGGWK